MNSSNSANVAGRNATPNAPTTYTFSPVHAQHSEKSPDTGSRGIGAADAMLTASTPYPHCGQ